MIEFKELFVRRNGLFWNQAIIILFVIVFTLALSACGSSATSTVTEDETVATELVLTATPTLPPTETPSPPVLALYAPAGSDPLLISEADNVLKDLATQGGLLFEIWDTLPTGEFPKNIQIVVLVGPETDAVAIANAHPSVQFISVGIPAIEPVGNLTVIGADGSRFDKQGFLAGYLAAVVTNDWRVGVISIGDTPEGKGANNGFLNGVVFFCGLCRPVQPPFYEYPIYYQINNGANQAEQQAAADYIIGSAVHTVYVYPGAGDEDVLKYLADASVLIIGGINPPAELIDSWVGTVTLDFNMAITQAWENIQSGKAGENISLPVTITNINEDLFSIGRQHWVQETIDDLNNGFIDTGIDPVTGEPK
jgi:hypothetical protein